MGGAGFQKLRLSYLGLGVSWTTWCTCGEDEETGLPELGRRELRVLGLLPGAGGLGRLPAVRAGVHSEPALCWRPLPCFSGLFGNRQKGELGLQRQEPAAVLSTQRFNHGLGPQF